jgi:hypothetical protein
VRARGSGRVVHRFEWAVLAATLALIPVLIIENDAKSQTWQDFAYAANWVIWGVFAAELVFILTIAPRKAAASALTGWTLPSSSLPRHRSASSSRH